MLIRTLILELNEDDEPEMVEGFNACVGAIHELMGQTMYNCREPQPDIAVSYPQGLDKIRQAPKELAILFQEYIDDAPKTNFNPFTGNVEEEFNFLEGMAMSTASAISLFNDFLLFVNGGIDPPKYVDGGDPQPIMVGGFVGDPSVNSTNE